MGTVVSVGSKDVSAPAYDTFSAANNQLSVPEVLVGDTSYQNVFIYRFLNAIEANYSPGVMTSASTLTNRNRYLISDTATQSTTANYMWA